MAFMRNKDLKLIVHPYIFVLKEGQEFKKDYLDYSLLLLQLTCPEKIESPIKKQRVFCPMPDIELIKSSFRQRRR